MFYYSVDGSNWVTLQTGDMSAAGVYSPDAIIGYSGFYYKWTISGGYIGISQFKIEADIDGEMSME